MRHRHLLPIATIVVWLLILLAWVMMGGCCGTKKVIETHDTLVVNHTDTLQQYIIRYKTDTLRMETERVVTLRETGETIRVNVYRDRWRVDLRHDTIYKYVSKADTTKVTSTDKVVKKKSNTNTFFMAIVIFCLLVIFIIWFTKVKRE